MLVSYGNVDLNEKYQTGEAFALSAIFISVSDSTYVTFLPNIIRTSQNVYPYQQVSIAVVGHPVPILKANLG